MSLLFRNRFSFFQPLMSENCLTDFNQISEKHPDSETLDDRRFRFLNNCLWRARGTNETSITKTLKERSGRGTFKDFEALGATLFRGPQSKLYKVAYCWGPLNFEWGRGRCSVPQWGCSVRSLISLIAGAACSIRSQPAVFTIQVLVEYFSILQIIGLYYFCIGYMMYI